MGTEKAFNHTAVNIQATAFQFPSNIVPINLRRLCKPKKKNVSDSNIQTCFVVLSNQQFCSFYGRFLPHPKTSVNYDHIPSVKFTSLLSKIIHSD